MLLATLAPFGAAAATPLEAQTPRPFVRDALLGLELETGAPVRAAVSPDTGLVTFLSFDRSWEPHVRLPATAPAAARALAFLDDHGAAFGVSGRDGLSTVRATGRDEVGIEHVRFRQTHRGVPVTGGELIVHLRGSAVVAVNGKTLSGLDHVEIAPAIDARAAKEAVRLLLERRFGVSGAALGEPRLEIFDRGLLEGRRGWPRLAWFVEARATDLREFVWVDAAGGSVLLHFSQLTDARVREVYDADDPDDGIYNVLPGMPVRGEGDPPTGDADADAAYDFSGDTYDYFFDEHGRDSYDDAGTPLRSSVHFCPSAGNCPFQNAYWNGVQMVYGEGFSLADDVVAHELTHAVTEFTANLFYYMQSGALNESFSDIFGETVDLLNGAGNDSPGVRWHVGEDLPLRPEDLPIRNMMDPTLEGDPGKMSDPQFRCLDSGTHPDMDRGGVHFNSGVPNHAYALMVDGGTYNGETVTGIGLTRAGKIQYRALSTYLTSASDFLDNYNALVQSCEDLVGVAGITAADCVEVGEALTAVEMAAAWPCTPDQVAVPAFCPAGQAPELWHSEDFESFALDACPSSAAPTEWCLNGPTSILGAFATSGTMSLWGYNRPVVDFITVSNAPPGTLPTGAVMQFNHSHGFENSGSIFWDGGVVEYSTDGGSSWLDAFAQGLITAGQTYGGTVEPGLNPLAEQSAFVADSWGYTATQLDLSSLAGETFEYRFGVGSDEVADDYGWFVDDVRIFTCAACVADRVLDATYNGLASFYGASSSIEAGAGFEVGAMESVTLEAPTVELTNDFAALGDLVVGNATCP